MRRFSDVSMNGERKTEINPEELEDDGTDDENDFFHPEDDWDEDSLENGVEPYEREYCD